MTALRPKAEIWVLIKSAAETWSKLKSVNLFLKDGEAINDAITQSSWLRQTQNFLISYFIIANHTKRIVRAHLQQYKTYGPLRVCTKHTNVKWQKNTVRQNKIFQNFSHFYINSVSRHMIIGRHEHYLPKPDLFKHWNSICDSHEAP